jgi:hypothetical protein
MSDDGSAKTEEYKGKIKAFISEMLMMSEELERLEAENTELARALEDELREHLYIQDDCSYAWIKSKMLFKEDKKLRNVADAARWYVESEEMMLAYIQEWGEDMWIKHKETSYNNGCAESFDYYQEAKECFLRALKILEVAP